MNGKLEITFDWDELMTYGQGRRNVLNLATQILDIGGSGRTWCAYTNTLTITRFPQDKVPDARDWLDAHGFTETDVQFIEGAGEEEGEAMEAIEALEKATEKLSKSVYALKAAVVGIMPKGETVATFENLMHEIGMAAEKVEGATDDLVTAKINAIVCKMEAEE